MTATKADVASFNEDKAVKDTIPESWLCVDCGVNTQPGCPDGPTTRIDLSLYGKSTVTLDDKSEVYSVKRELWEKAGMRPWGGCLCVGCLEQRLGRKLRPKDFSSHDRQVWARLPCTDRLLDRRGFRQIRVRTKNGEKEVIIPKGIAAEMAKVVPPGELPFIEEEEEDAL